MTRNELIATHLVTAVETSRRFRRSLGADDATGEAVALLVRLAGQWGDRDPEEFGGYLVTAVRRRLGRLARRINRVKIYAPDDLPEPMDPHPEPGDSWEEALRDCGYWGEVARSVWIDGLPIAVVARVEGVSERCVRERLSRVRTILLAAWC